MATTSTEVVTDRTATSSTYQNADGTRAKRISATPVHYQDATGAWQNIDTALEGDPSVVGGIMSTANTWTAHFAPLGTGGGLTITGLASPVGFAPIGAALVSPSISPTEPNQVVYPNAWPGADLEYTVRSDQVEEHIVLHSSAAAATYAFTATGSGLAADPLHPGGLVATGALGGIVAVAPPVALDASGAPQSAAAPTLTQPTTGVVSVGVSAAWLAALPASSFPIDVDPSVDFGGGSTCYAAQQTVSPCEVRVGNYATNDAWQTTTYFDYTSLFGDNVVAADVNLWNQDAGVNGSDPVYVYNTAAFRINGFGTLQGQFNADQTGGTLSSDRTNNATNPSLANMYNYYTTNRIAGIQLFFVGNETLGQIHYHEYQSFLLTLVYEVPPNSNFAVAPGNGSVFHPWTITGQSELGYPPTLAVAAAALPPGDDGPVEYRFTASETGNPDVASVFDSGWVTSNQVTGWGIPINATVYWHAYVSTDWGLDSLAPSYVWSFRMVNGAPSSSLAFIGSPPPEVVTTTTPSFSDWAVDPDRDPMQYLFQVATSLDGTTSSVVNSGWQQSSTWTPPAGNLADGGTYYVVVKAEDLTNDLSGIGAWSAPMKVTVSLRLGDASGYPGDGLAGATVNLASGNVVVQASTPSYKTVGDPIGFKFTYNSMARSATGLSATYYQDEHQDGNVDPGDPVIYHDMEPGPPTFSPAARVAGGYVVGVWTGAISVPAGTWTLSAPVKTDSRLWLNGVSIPITAGAQYAFGPAPVAFRLEASTFSRGNTLLNGALNGSNGTVVLGSANFVPSDRVLPDGWSESSDGLVSAGYTTVRQVTPTQVQVVDGNGASHVYSQAAGGWSPPSGETSTLAQNPDGSWKLDGDDGYTYAFNTSGQLMSMTSPTDDAHPAAWTMTYTVPNNLDAGNPQGIQLSFPPRLTTIADATGRTVTLSYGGGNVCPSGTGFDADAPTDMLCQITYTGFGGGTTNLYYSGGHLARITEPGSAAVGYPTTDFGYSPATLDGVTTSLLSSIRSPLVNDAITAGTITEPPTASGEPANAHETVIAYEPAADGSWALGQAASITAPTASDAPADFNARQVHSYTYSAPGPDPTGVDVTVAGEAVSGGYDRQVSLDAAGHATVDIGADGVATNTTWDDINNRELTKIDHHAPSAAGLETTWVYDPLTRLTDTYGPAAPSCFSPVADGYGNTFWTDNATCTTPPPAHTTTAYDQNIAGLGAAWYSNTTQPAGAPALHTTSSGQETFSTGTPGAAVTSSPHVGFAGALNGYIDVPGTVGQPSNQHLVVNAGGGAQVFVDDNQLASDWGGPTQTAVGVDNPVDFWRLGDPAGTMATDTGSNPGTYGGGVTLGAPWLTGATDGSTAATLDGTSGYVGLPSGFSWLAGGFSMDAWVKLTAAHPYARVLEFGTGQGTNNVAFNTGPSGSDLNLTIYNNGSGTEQGDVVQASNVLTMNTWEHVATTFAPSGAGGIATLYLNGAVVATKTLATAPNQVTYTQNAIGRSDWASDPYLAGSIANVAAYGSALSQARIQAHDQAATTPMAIDTNSPTAHAITAGWHKLKINYQSLGITPSMSLNWGTIGATLSPVPTTALDPAYDLATTNTTVDTSSGSPSKVTATAYTGGGMNAVLGLPTSTTVDPGGQNLVTSNSYETTNSGTGYYRLHQETLPAGNSTVNGYYGTDNPGAVTTAVNPCVAGSPEVDQGGALWQSASSDGRRVTQYVHDAEGDVVASQINSDGWTCDSFDGRGRLTQEVIPAYGSAPSRTVTFNYQVGNTPLVTSESDPAGTITTTLDLLGRTVGYTDVHGSTTTTAYDQAGRDVSTAGPYGNTTSAYDKLDRSSTSSWNGTTAATNAYDAQSELAGVSYGINNTSVAYGYDATGKLSSDTINGANGQPMYTNTESSSQSGRVMSDAINGTAYGYTYDTAGRLITAAALGHAYTYSFTPNGGCGALTAAGTNSDRTAMTDNGVATSYCYGASDQLISTTAANMGTVAYDTDSNTTTLGPDTLAYDGADRNTEISSTVATSCNPIAYQVAASAGTYKATWSQNGSAAWVTTGIALKPVTGAVIKQVQQATTNISTGGRSTITVTLPTKPAAGNSLVIAVGTNPSSSLGLVQSITGGGVTWHKGAATSSSGAGDEETWYGTASSGTGTTITVTMTNGNDQVGATVQEFSGIASSPLDATGVKGGSTATAVGPSLTTTVAGDLVFETANTYNDVTIPPGNPWTAVVGPQEPGGQVVTTQSYYTRDATGRVAERSTYIDSTKTSDVIYGYGDGSAVPLGEKNKLTGVQRSYVALPGGAQITETGGAGIWSYSDLHGDVVLTADQSGAATGGTTSFDAFGNVVSPTTQGSAYVFGYEGRHDIGTDSTTLNSLVQMGARVYSAGLGRFLSVDPVPRGSANEYDYVNQDPINATDLSGACSGGAWCIVVKLIAVVPYGVYRAARYVRHSIPRPIRFVGIAFLAAEWLGLRADMAIDRYKNRRFHDHESQYDEGRGRIVYWNPLHGHGLLGAGPVEHNAPGASLVGGRPHYDW